MRWIAVLTKRAADAWFRAALPAEVLSLGAFALDHDGDGAATAAEYALMGDPADAGSLPEIWAEPGAVVYRQRLAATDAAVAAEFPERCGYRARAPSPRRRWSGKAPATASIAPP
ncbi:MAG: hypothetical protein R3F11_12165 [Verrucomicrobiales bacterium]